MWCATKARFTLEPSNQKYQIVFKWKMYFSFINPTVLTFAKCSIVTITLDSLETRSIAPPIPFTIFPCKSANQLIHQ